MATISGVIVTIDAVWRCLSQMLLASDSHREEAMAVWSGTSMAPIFAGTSQHGYAFAATEMSHFGGGGGARTFADGVDTSGIVFNTTPNMPNIEDQEAEYPVLYLYRRHLQDSGGPGRFRGGRSGELAYTVHDAPKDDLVGLFAGTGAEMPNGIGIAGGLPGCSIRIGRFVGSDVGERIRTGEPLPDTLDAVNGTHHVMQSKHPRVPIVDGDVWHHCWQAGGGYGDPLLREPAAVARDVARGAVSVEAARDIYGVELDEDGGPDDLAVERRRRRIRQQRLVAAVPVEPGDAVTSFAGSRTMAFGDALLVDEAEDAVNCPNCGHRHCGRSDNLLEHLREVRQPLSAAGPVRGEDLDVGRFHLRQLVCGSCGHLVETQVALNGAPRPYMQIGAA
jgi:N-methylhydantoinase B